MIDDGAPLDDERGGVAGFVGACVDVTGRRQAEELGHHGIAIDLDDLIRDESNHRDEIKLVLQRWGDD